MSNFFLDGWIKVLPLQSPFEKEINYYSQMYRKSEESSLKSGRKEGERIRGENNNVDAIIYHRRRANNKEKSLVFVDCVKNMVNEYDSR